MKFIYIDLFITSIHIDFFVSQQTIELNWVNCLIIVYFHPNYMTMYDSNWIKPIVVSAWNKIQCELKIEIDGAYSISETPSCNVAFPLARDRHFSSCTFPIGWKYSTLTSLLEISIIWVSEYYRPRSIFLRGTLHFEHKYIWLL